MFNTIKLEILGKKKDFLECDSCKQGIGLDTKDKKALNKFRADHKNCTKKP